MIQTEHVHVRQQSAHAVDVPAVAGAAQSRPVIDGIAPELPLSAEVVGRYPGDEAGPVLLVQEEQVGIGPHVARVGRHEEGQVTDQPHALGAGVGPQARSP